MSEPKFTPADITVEHSNQTMTIEWADGHVSDYKLHGLRKACPCVTCRGGHENMGTPVDMEVFDEIIDIDRRIEDLEIIGNHALKITWDDGHDTGMYRWEYLRELCTCRECRTAT